MERRVVRVSSLPYRSACPGWEPSPWSSDAASRGTAVHELVQRTLSGEDVPIPEMARKYNVPVEEMRTFLANLPVLEGEWRPEVPLHAEREINGVEYVLSGTADAVSVRDDGGVHVIDWKTTRIEHDPAEASLQLLTYTALAIRQLGCDHGYGMLVFLASGNKSSTAKIDRDRADAILDEAFAVASQSSDARRVGSVCSYCRLKAECDAYLAELKPLMAVSGLPALTKEHAGQAFVLRRTLEAAVSRLKSWLKDEVARAGGELSTAEGTLKLVSQVRRSGLSPKVVEETCREIGMDEELTDRFLKLMDSKRASFESQTLRMSKRKEK